MEFGVETLNRLVELGEARIITDDEGKEYLDKGGKAVLIKPSRPTAETTSTLTGLVQLLESMFEADLLNRKDVYIQVGGPSMVLVRSNKSDNYGDRQTWVVTERIKPETEFNFGNYIGQEQFLIQLRSLFVQDFNLDGLVAVAGNLAAKNEIQQQDDGFTQQVHSKTGVHMVTERIVNPRVTLKPYRTFLEAEQPASDYIFRVKYTEGRGNECALFLADGGMWRLTAMQNVRTWLSNQLKGSTVDGLGDIPIIC